MNQATISAIEKARARLAALKAAKQEETAAAEATLTAAKSQLTTLTVPALSRLGWTIDDSVDWNTEQEQFIHAALGGKSLVLTGAAGTGKTSVLKGFIKSGIANNIFPIISPSEATKWLKYGKPGVVLTSFTNMAVRQIAKHFSNDVTCVTLHKLLEYAPVFYEVENEQGELVKTMRFEPTRNRYNKLPRSLKTIVIDESSMVSTELVALLIDALPNPAAVQWIFLGDINQLRPVYGKAILGQKLMELPIIELTQVYRQALLSPIITLAHEMKDGKSISVPLVVKNGKAEKIIRDCGEHGKLVIAPWSKSIAGNEACLKAADFLKAAIQQGIFDVYKDMGLCPHNVGSADPDKNFSAMELNRSLADWLGRQRDAKVFEVIAGFKTHYFAVGDKVLVNKREAIIQKIQWNRNYSGKRPVNPELYKLDRWGGATKRSSSEKLSQSAVYEAENATFDVDAVLASMVATNTTVEDRKASSSHTITVRFINGSDPTQWSRFDSAETDENFEELTLESAGEVNEMLFGYVISVHKSQGSEWRRVFILLHKVHNQMCSRELLYTAITRAAKELYIICEADQGMKAGTLTKAAKAPGIKGNNLAEKLVFLKEQFERDAAEAAKKEAAASTTAKTASVTGNNLGEDDE